MSLGLNELRRKTVWDLSSTFSWLCWFILKWYKHIISYVIIRIKSLGPGRCRSNFTSVKMWQQFQVLFSILNSNSFYKIVACVLIELLSVVCPRISLMQSQHWFRYHMAWCSQATSITWANVDPDPHCHMASPGYHELITLDIIRSMKLVLKKSMIFF